MGALAMRKEIMAVPCAFCSLAACAPADALAGKYEGRNAYGNLFLRHYSPRRGPHRNPNLAGHLVGWGRRTGRLALASRRGTRQRSADKNAKCLERN